MVNYSQDFPFSWEIYLFSLSNIYNGQFNKNLNWKFIIILPWLANWPCFARSPPTSSPAMKPRTVPNKTRRLTHTRKQDRLPDFPRSSDIITLSLDKHKCHFYIKTVPSMNLSFNFPSQSPSQMPASLSLMSLLSLWLATGPLSTAPVSLVLPRAPGILLCPLPRWPLESWHWTLSCHQTPGTGDTRDYLTNTGNKHFNGTDKPLRFIYALNIWWSKNCLWAKLLHFWLMKDIFIIIKVLNNIFF